MSMDGKFIERLCIELDNNLAGGRIQKIYQLSKTDFLFIVRTPGETKQLYVSVSTSLTRIHLSAMRYDRPENPGGFCMLLRKYLEGGIITSIKSLEGDRIIKILVENHDELGDIEDYGMYMEILGRYANIVITEKNDIIIDAFKHISPFDEVGRTIEKGAIYLPPFDGKTKTSDKEGVTAIFSYAGQLNRRYLVDNIRGISPVFAEYLLREMSKPGVSGLTLLDDVQKLPINPVMMEKSGKREYYYFDIFDIGQKTFFPSLSLLLDAYFNDLGREERNRQMSKYLIQFVKRETDKLANKLEKLSQDLAKADEADIYRIKGDLILQCQNEIAKASSSHECFSYELDRNINIELDPLSSAVKNANQYFKKYRKLKNSVAYIEEQITIAKEELEYFRQLDDQIETASLIDLEEIRQELATRGMLRQKTGKTRKKTPNYETYTDNEGMEILVGKNNIQNDYITNRVARPNEWWFHVKNSHGAHVIARSESELKEPQIRTAANLAALFSEARNSSSVPVDYTRVKHLKKVPGTIGSFVTYTNQKTIFIDPDNAVIEHLKSKKK
ncbi:MAG TPA: NFACT family protein [Bacillota bacterium]|nr:NFACT family protein [Bacillota bacterium]HPJ85634.1 NFACT family protein [Bacillota bacterium]HPQ61414.1 NFACT family protein [Bacillota bacterium]